MPSKCCIVSCGATKRKKQTNLSFHRLPRDAIRRRMWLEAIGKEHFSKSDHIFICSLHFKESSFNKTLDVVRLRDDAVPSLYIQQNSNLTLGPENRIKKRIDPNIPSGNQTNPGLTQALKENSQLQKQVANQRRTIKNLNETMRKQKIKIANFKEIIKELSEKSTISYLCEKSSGED